MNAPKLVVAAAFAVLIAACGTSESEPATSAPPTASVVTTSTSVESTASQSRDAGFELLDVCLGAINTAAADVDLGSPDVEALLADVFVDGLPPECDVLIDTSPEDFGLTQDDVAARLEALLPAQLLEFMLSPVE
ncbi:hypothetical protein MNBD_ACTINO02-980 [hydrothermal vent metagenome]|uniref:Lipoprotein n=1 Tax=hydrothermal vent metagenome TaxID=652676 RepID=A0A3B0T3L3_9ZZZZ